MMEVLSFQSAEAHQAVELQKELKRARKQLDIPDLFIAATALVNDLPVATLDRKHFERVKGLAIFQMDASTNE